MDINKELIEFITANIHARPEDILMKYINKNLCFDLKFAVMQLTCRNKARKKIPNFLSFPAFLFPDTISSEQASDQRVAQFHASLIGTGKNVVDLTSGLGIDAMTITKQGNKVTCIELNPMKAEMLAYNAKVINLPNLEIVCTDCVDFLQNLSSLPDIFFIDPARRDVSNKRTYALSDCLPDVTKFYRKIIECGCELYIKSSPLLDISAIQKELDFIHSIYVVSVKNECKEVLIHLKKDNTEAPLVHAVDLDDNGILSSFSINHMRKEREFPIAEIEEIQVGFYFYEPNASLMKLNAAYDICNKFTDIKKISANTELYLSKTLLIDFPGRKIRIEKILSSKDLRHLKGKGFSIVARNYPTTAQDLRKKFGVKESQDNFIYAFRAGNAGKPMIIEGKRVDAQK